MKQRAPNSNLETAFGSARSCANHIRMLSWKGKRKWRRRLRTFLTFGQNCKAGSTKTSKFPSKFKTMKLSSGAIGSYSSPMVTIIGTDRDSVTHNTHMCCSTSAGLVHRTWRLYTYMLPTEVQLWMTNWKFALTPVTLSPMYRTEYCRRITTCMCDLKCMPGQTLRTTMIKVNQYLVQVDIVMFFTQPFCFREN